MSTADKLSCYAFSSPYTAGPGCGNSPARTGPVPGKIDIGMRHKIAVQEFWFIRVKFYFRIIHYGTRVQNPWDDCVEGLH